jgi:hypothetical protein
VDVLWGPFPERLNVCEKIILHATLLSKLLLAELGGVNPQHLILLETVALA